MGKALVKTETGYVQGVPYIRQASGWARVKVGYRKTSSTFWSPFLSVDSNPPGVPIITGFSRVGTSLQLTIKAPADSDVAQMRVKVGKRIAANLETDSDYISSPDGLDPAWSEWLVAPGQTRTKTFPVSGTLTNNTVYYVTAWAQDSSRNYSNPATASVKYSVPVATPPKAKTATIDPTDSGTFRRTTNAYYRNDKYLRIGGTSEDVGLLYYSSKIPTQLKNAKVLTRARLKLQRISGRGYKGQAQFHLFAHTMTGYSKVDIDTGGRILYTDTVTSLADQGQTVTLDVPEAWYDDILSGKVKGFGIASQISSGNETIDPYVAAFYGDNTSTGKVILEYTE